MSNTAHGSSGKLPLNVEVHDPQLAVHDSKPAPMSVHRLLSPVELHKKMVCLHKKSQPLFILRSQSLHSMVFLCEYVRS